MVDGSNSDYDLITGNDTVSGAALLLVSGIITLAIAVVGIIGACAMWRPLLVIVSTLFNYCVQNFSQICFVLFLLLILLGVCCLLFYFPIFSVYNQGFMQMVNTLRSLTTPRKLGCINIERMKITF